MSDSSTRRLRILVAEDEVDLREIMTYILESEGNAEVLQAGTGQEAMRLLEQHRDLDLIFCDYNMPEGNGGDVYRFIRERGLDVPYVMVSSDRPEDHPIFQGAELAGYVSKPFVKQGLLDLVQGARGQSTLPPTDVEVLDESAFLKLGLASFAGVTELSFDVYVRLSDRKFIRFMKAGDPFGDNERGRFQAKQITEVFVKRAKASELFRQFKSGLLNIPRLLSVTPTESVRISARTSAIIRDLSVCFGWSEEVQDLTNQSIQVVLTQLKRSGEFTNFLERLEFHANDYFGSHCALLAFVANGLANEIGWTSELTAYKLSFAAYLHDMELTDAQILRVHDLNRMGGSPEFSDLPDVQKYLQHPLKMVERLAGWNDLPPDVATIIGQHHEQMDGKGFPLGLPARKIAPLSALFIIAQDFVDFQLVQARPGSAQFQRNLVNLFLTSRESVYTAGQFRQIFQALAKGVARSKLAS